MVKEYNDKKVEQEKQLEKVISAKNSLHRGNDLTPMESGDVDFLNDFRCTKNWLKPHRMQRSWKRKEISFITVSFQAGTRYDVDGPLLQQ